MFLLDVFGFLNYGFACLLWAFAYPFEGCSAVGMAVFGIVRVAIDERQHHHDRSRKADRRAATNSDAGKIGHSQRPTLLARTNEWQTNLPKSRCNGAKSEISFGENATPTTAICRAYAGEKQTNARFVRVRAPSLSALLGVPSRRNAKH